MSDKQTTALLLLILLAGAFYLYRTGNLSTVAGAFTGKSPGITNPSGTSASLNYRQLVQSVEAPPIASGSGTGNNNAGSGATTVGFNNVVNNLGQAAQIYAQSQGF